MTIPTCFLRSALGWLLGKSWAGGFVGVGIETVLTLLDVTPTKAVLWEYGFDWLDRLVTVKKAEAVDVASLPASPLGPTALQRSYVFDESDNRTFFANEVLPQVDHVNDVTYYYKYKSIDDNGTTRYSDQLEEILIYENAAGHRTVGDFDSFESLEHDQDGNLTQRTSTGEEISYQWTALDRLKRVESSTNGRMQDARYDVNGLRERKLASGALTQFKNGNSSVEYGVGISTAASGPGATNSAAPSISYISGHMTMGAEIDGEFVYHLGDALSTVRDVVDHTGTVIKSFEFDEYGNLLSSTGSGATSPKTWIGGLSVNDDRADSGMFNMGHRNYAAGVLGMFISRDPIGHAGGLNLYAYPTNPVSFVDPDGLLRTKPDGSFVVFFPNGLEISTYWFGGKENGFNATGLDAILYADDGTPIKAFYLTEADKQGAQTDCHGLTFTKGEFWIDNDEVEALLRGDGYMPLRKGELPGPEDVAIYRKKNGKIHHSARPIESGKKDPLVFEISGIKRSPQTSLSTESPGGSCPTFYRRRHRPSLSDRLKSVFLGVGALGPILKTRPIR